MSIEMKKYDNGEVVIISSKPVAERRKHSRKYLDRVDRASQALSQTLKDIERVSPKRAQR